MLVNKTFAQYSQNTAQTFVSDLAGRFRNRDHAPSQRRANRVSPGSVK
jgi:hypothetical protein